MTFDFTPTDDGFRIHDTIENAWTDVDVGGSVEPSPASTDVFRVPLDEAVTVETDALHLDANMSVIVRDQSGAIVDRSLPGERLEVESGSYELDTTFTLFRLYVSVEDTAILIEDTPDGITFAFDGPTTVTLGIRSHHEQPAGVVTTSQDPRDVMRAVSTFGSAMKTFSPERSFPSLRGHPPELAVRGQTSIPASLSPPETGITVEVPPEYSAVFTSAPLAYYLGATIEPGLEPRLVVDDVVHEFDPDVLSTSIFDVLHHCFLLDTVVRTVGIYPPELSAQRRLEERVSIDREHLYDLPIGERTAHYLDVPLDATRDLLTWPAVADIDPVPLNAEALPYVTYRMAAVRSPPAGRARHSECCTPEDEQPAEHTPAPSSSSLRSFTPGGSDGGNRVSFVEPEPFDADHHIWVGDGLPVTGSKPTLGSYLRSSDAAPRDGVINVHVVVTDPAADSHVDALASQYSDEGCTVTVHDNPTTSELKDVLLADVDFLHYRGTVTDAGIECLDGPLDVRILPRTGVSAFFLDGKCSFRQGLPLIRVGSIGGVVTTDDEGPAGDHPGLTLAALLNFGYPLGPAVDVLTELDDARYTIVGDSYHQLCKSTTLPVLLKARPERSTPDTITPDSRVYPSQGYGLGSTYGYGGVVDEVEYLTGTHEITYTRDDFLDTADQIECPLLVDQELHWADDYTPDELWNLLQ